MKNTQKVTEKQKKSNITRNNSIAYLGTLNFEIEDETAYCQSEGCNFKSDDFFEAEDHWYKIHYAWSQ